MYFRGFCPENILTFFAKTVFKLVFDLIITIAYIYFLLSDHFLCLLFRLAGDHLYVVSINFMVSLQNCASNLRKSIIPTKILLKSAKKSLIQCSSFSVMILKYGLAQFSVAMISVCKFYSLRMYHYMRDPFVFFKQQV